MTECKLNIPGAMDAARQQGLDFAIYRDALAAIIESTKDRDALIEALSRDIIAATVGHEARAIHRTMMMFGATDDEARSVAAALIEGVQSIAQKGARA